MIISNEKEILNKNLDLIGLSEEVISISSVVRPTFPDIWFFPWCKDDDNVYKLIRERIKNNKEKHREGEKFLDDLIKAKDFSWPNFFRNLKDAQFFMDNYLSSAKNLYIVSVNLPQSYYKDFLLNENNENSHEVSLYDFLKESEEYDILEKDNILGFDICGYSNNQFYSYICNGLQKDFTKHGKILNHNSLIDKYKDAKELIELIDCNEIQAEEILWYPWLVLKCF